MKEGDSRDIKYNLNLQTWNILNLLNRFSLATPIIVAGLARFSHPVNSNIMILLVGTLSFQNHVAG